MKILMVAVFDERSTNNSQAEGFENNGCDVIRYNYREKGKQLGNANRDNEIISLCLEHKPEIVFFSKCNDVDIRVINECNKHSSTIMWYMDPLRRGGRFSKSAAKKIKHCTYTFCALSAPYKKALSISPNSTYFVQEGFDEKINYPIKTPYVNDVAFIGVLRGHRGAYHDAIGFRIYNDAYGIKHSEAVSETKINLNFTEGGTSDRTYKVLASKGFLLTEPWPNMEADFIVGKDLDVFNDVGNLKEKIAYYLENEQEREAIAENGYRTVQKFSRTNWAKKILSVIK